MICILSLLFVLASGFTYTPVNITMDIDYSNINNIFLDDNGKYVCVTTFDGNAILLNTDGTIVANFTRDVNLGEFILLCKFSPKSNYLVLNGAIGATSFISQYGIVRLYNINTNAFLTMPNSTDGTYLLRNYAYPYPNVFTFDIHEKLFAIVGPITSDISNIYVLNLTSLTYTTYITTSIFPSALLISNNLQYLIWKESSHGNITIWNINNNTLYRYLSTIANTSDPIFTYNPSLILNNIYLLSGSTNINGIYIYNIITGCYTILSYWNGQDIVIINDYVLNVVRGNLTFYDLRKGCPGYKILRPANYTIDVKYNDIFEGLLLLDNNTLVFYDIFPNTSLFTGIWNYSLNQIGVFNNQTSLIPYTIDIFNNLIEWVYSP
jgi:hypothetical protein